MFACTKQEKEVTGVECFVNKPTKRKFISWTKKPFLKFHFLNSWSRCFKKSFPTCVYSQQGYLQNELKYFTITNWNEWLWIPSSFEKYSSDSWHFTMLWLSWKVVYELGMSLGQNYSTWHVLAMGPNQCWFGPGRTWAHLSQNWWVRLGWAKIWMTWIPNQSFSRQYTKLLLGPCIRKVAIFVWVL